MASRTVTGVTLGVLSVLLVVGAVVGWRFLTAPLPGEEDGTQSAGACTSELAAGEEVAATEVRVSVFNAGTRQGLAEYVRTALTRRGFLAGEIGNAPSDLRDVARVVVYAPDERDPAARLVALQFGERTRVVASDDDLGPGVDVVVGNGYQWLARGAPRTLTAEVAGSGC